MLPLVGQKLALQDKNLGTSLMAAGGGANRDRPDGLAGWSHGRPVGTQTLISGRSSRVAIGGVIYTISDNPYWLVRVQLLDGISAGIYGAIFPIIVADVMRGTG
jgi:hypothetical protein